MKMKKKMKMKIKKKRKTDPCCMSNLDQTGCWYDHGTSWKHIHTHSHTHTHTHTEEEGGGGGRGRRRRSDALLFQAHAGQPGTGMGAKDVDISHLRRKTVVLTKRGIDRTQGHVPVHHDLQEGRRGDGGMER
jgi:hypothetical protein